MQTLDEVIRALRITYDTVLFVDRDQINLRALEECKGLPRGLLIVGVTGQPNVQAMAIGELEQILSLKRQAVARAKEPSAK